MSDDAKRIQKDIEKGKLPDIKTSSSKTNKELIPVRFSKTSGETRSVATKVYCGSYEPYKVQRRKQDKITVVRLTTGKDPKKVIPQKKIHNGDK